VLSDPLHAAAIQAQSSPSLRAATKQGTIGARPKPITLGAIPAARPGGLHPGIVRQLALRESHHHSERLIFA
jgi:hypothetical protein